MATTGPLIQNFSLAAGDGAILHVNVDPDTIGVTLVGSDIIWRVFEQKWGLPDRDAVVLTKRLDDGLQITDTVLQLFDITIGKTDFLDVTPGNYYHETLVITSDSNRITVNYGMLAITQTQVRDD